jgi:hypothetical protein
VRDALFRLAGAAEWRAWLRGLPLLARLELGRCGASLRGSSPASAAGALNISSCTRRATLDAFERAQTASLLFPQPWELRLRLLKTQRDGYVVSICFCRFRLLGRRGHRPHK